METDILRALGSTCSALQGCVLELMAALGLVHTPAESCQYCAHRFSLATGKVDAHLTIIAVIVAIAGMFGQRFTDAMLARAARCWR